MSEEIRKALLNLKAISSIDSRVAQIKAERKRLEDQLTEKKQAVEIAENDAASKLNTHAERKRVYQREENFLRDEQSKLVNRRKALQSLQSYKLQQAAEKEIEASSKQLSAQEENLITMLDAVEDLEQIATEAQTVLDGLKSELEALETDAAETFKTLDERANSQSTERAELIAETPADALRQYDRLSERYPMDTVVAFKDNTCGGCFLNLGPQVMVQIGRADQIVRCRGCGRILYLGNSEEE